MPRRSPLVVRPGSPGNQPGPSSIERPLASDPDGCLRPLDDPSSRRQAPVVVPKQGWAAAAALVRGLRDSGTQARRVPEPDVRARDAYLRG
jgi:hypothetical protein